MDELHHAILFVTLLITMHAFSSCKKLNIMQIALSFEGMYQTMPLDGAYINF